MVAITTQPTVIVLPRPDRGRSTDGRSAGSERHGERPALRLVPPLGASPFAADTGARRGPKVVLAVVATVVAVVAMAFLVMSDPLPVAGSAPVSMGTHVVVDGETMWSIARDVAPTGEAAIYVERLVDANGTATVAAGQVVQLPIP